MSHDITPVAPPKNKKKRVMVWSLAINRPPLRPTGFGDLRAKQSLFRRWLEREEGGFGRDAAEPADQKKA